MKIENERILELIDNEILQISNEINFLCDINNICNNSYEELANISEQTKNTIYNKLGFPLEKIYYINSCIKFIKSKSVTDITKKHIIEFVELIKKEFNDEIIEVKEKIIIQQSLIEFKNNIQNNNYDFKTLKEYRELLDILSIEDQEKMEILKNIVISRSEKINNVINYNAEKISEDLNTNYEDAEKEDIKRKVIIYFDKGTSMFCKQYNKFGNRNKKTTSVILNKMINDDTQNVDNEKLMFYCYKDVVILYFKSYDCDFILEVFGSNILDNKEILMRLNNIYNTDIFKFFIREIKNNKYAFDNIAKQSRIIFDEILKTGGYHVQK